jgi:hemoglobin-like flavoprotein
MSAIDQRQLVSPSAACAIAAQLIQAVALLRPRGTVQVIKRHQRLQVVLEHYSILNIHLRSSQRH